MAPVEFKLFEKCGRGKSVRDILSQEKFTRRFQLDVSDLYSASPDQAYRELLFRYARSIGKPVAGEKSPGNELYYPAIMESLKGFDVRFIHLVRNPFDAIASFKHAYFRTQTPHHNPLAEVTARAERWRRSLCLGLARALYRPEVYCLVKFEDLTNDTVNTTTKLCEFLDVEFEQDRMLELADFSKHRDNTSFSDRNSPMPTTDSESTGRIRALESRKGHLTEEEIQAVGAICGEMAQAIGYQDEDFNAVAPAKQGSGVGGGVRGNISRIANRFLKR
jgi:hypothetical protein